MGEGTEGKAAEGSAVSDADRDRIGFIPIFGRALGVAMGYELVGGKYPKLTAEWTSGDRLTQLATGVIDGGSWYPVTWVLDALVLPNAALMAYMVLGLQAGLSLSLMLGFFVRAASVIALPMFVSMNVLIQTMRTPGWYVVGLLVLIITQPEARYGLDRVLVNRLRTRPGFWPREIVEWIRLDFGVLFRRRRHNALLIAALLIASALALVQMAGTADHVLRLMLLEIVFFGGVLTLASLHHRASTIAAIELGSLMLRVRLAFALLWPVLADRKVKTTGLPGFADGSATSTLLADVIGTGHWPPLGLVASDVLAPNATTFAVVAGVAQVSLAIALLVGYRLRLVGWAAVGYVLAMCLIGYTRTTQYALLFALAVGATGAGWPLSIDRFVGRPRPPSGLPRSIAWGLAALAATSLLLLTRVPLAVDPYSSHVGASVFLAIAVTVTPIAVGILAPAVIVGLRQRAGRDRSEVRTGPATTGNRG